MEQLHNRDTISFKIDKKIKYLCSEEEKFILTELLKELKKLLRDKPLLDHQIQNIQNEIDKILLYNIYET